MADFISKTLGTLNDKVDDYAETVFVSSADAVMPVIQAAGILGLAFIAINAVMAFTPISMSTYLRWTIRYLIIFLMATSWAHFQPIYEILTVTPGTYGASLFATGAPTLNAGMDEMVTNLFTLADQASAEGWFTSITLTSVILAILGTGMAAVAILVSAIAKVGLAMAISFGPLMIGCALFNATKPLFESWTKFTLGFALIPLVLAGVMGAVMGIAQANFSADVSDASSMAQVAGGLIMVLCALFMMWQVPTFCTGLAGSVVAAGTGIREAKDMGRQMSGAGGMGQAAANVATGTYRRTQSGLDGAADTRSSGGGAAAQMKSFVANATRMSAERQATMKSVQNRRKAVEAQRLRDARLNNKNT